MAAIRNRGAANLSIDYDRNADVLYVALGKPRPAEGQDRPGGVVFRYAMDDDAPCGVTVVGFRRNGWHEKTAELATLIAAHLGAGLEQVRTLVCASIAAE